MHGFNYLKNGDYLERVKQNSGTLSLLAKKSNLEVMEQVIVKDKEFCVFPGDNVELVEFFYIIYGTVINKEMNLRLESNDLFYVNELEKPVYLTAEEETKLLYVINDSLFVMLSDSINNLSSKLEILEHKDIYTEKHSLRVMNYTYELAHRLGLEVNMMAMSYASLFHDIGKLEIPDEILLKPGKLSPKEYEVIKQHPELGKKFTDDIRFMNISKIIEQHHEYIDGSGYPNGLKGDDICIEAKLIALADIYDAMTSERVYRKALTDEVAIAEILKYRGVRYDEKITDEFIKMINEKMIKEKEGER